MRERGFEIINNQGLKIRGKLFIPQGSGPFSVVIFLHGLTGTYRTGKNLSILKALSGIGILGVGFDHANEAVSTSEGDFYNLTFNSRREDLEAVLNFILNYQLVDKGRIGLCGHSLGGVLAAVFASERVAFKALALVSAVWDPKVEMPLLLEITAEEWKKQGFVDFEKLDPLWKVGNKKLSYNYLESFLNYFPEEVTGKVGQPVLIIHGDEDDLVTSDKSERYFTALPGKKKLVLIKGGNHTFSDPNSLKNVIRELNNWFKENLIYQS